MSKVIDIIHKSKSTFVLRTEKPIEKILPGQCFSIGTPDTSINREYSIYSSPQEDYLDFLIREVEDGYISKKLKTLKKNDNVEINGPFGEFLVPLNYINKKFLFICTGTGIAPFHSFVKSFEKLDYKILHGIRYSDEKYDSKVYDENRYIPCVSKNDEGESLHVTDYLKNNEKFLNHFDYIYLCGNRMMISETLDILDFAKISGDKIITEVFF